jgi:hypothetical protein
MDDGRWDGTITKRLFPELEENLVSKYLPALPDNHWAHNMYQEILYLRNEVKMPKIGRVAGTLDASDWERNGVLIFIEDVDRGK